MSTDTRPSEAGFPLVSPHAQSIPMDDLMQRLRMRTGSTNQVVMDDAGHQPPFDPLQTPGAKAETKLIYRDIPLVTIQNQWTPPEVTAALSSHMIGIFEMSGQLADSILGDDRVQATLGSRTSGLFGREVRFEPANDSSEARECLDAWRDHWPNLAAISALTEIQMYSVIMGFMPAQLVWDTSSSIWKPYMRPWHPRYTYYNWDVFKYIAISLDGQHVIMPGNGKWVMHSAWGNYRAWIHGAIRAVAEPWLLRHFAKRDMARFSEVHGMPIRKAICPAAGDEALRDQFQAQVSRLGFETTILLPQGVDRANGGNSYDLELIEAKDTSFDVFPKLIADCDMSITLALLFQNLTTEVTSGSFAATTAHMDIRQSGLQSDNAAWRHTLHNQIARPFAWLNFGDPDLAPVTYWDVQPREDFQQNAKQFQQFGTAVEVLRRGGVEFTDTEALRAYAANRFGLIGLPDFKITTPVAGGGLGK